ncbi:MAG: hypothetical protein RSB10_05820 [Clostridia bacterium]
MLQKKFVTKKLAPKNDKFNNYISFANYNKARKPCANKLVQKLKMVDMY